MTILLETPHPVTKRLLLHIHTDVQINISATQAQHDITQYVHSKISSQMHAKSPILLLGSRVYWRVPIHLTLPSIGDAGEVGTIDVDVETGQAKITETIIKEIECHAEDIARRFTFYAKRNKSHTRLQALRRTHPLIPSQEGSFCSDSPLERGLRGVFFVLWCATCSLWPFYSTR